MGASVYDDENNSRCDTIIHAISVALEKSIGQTDDKTKVHVTCGNIAVTERVDNERSKTNRAKRFKTDKITCMGFTKTDIRNS